MGKRGFNILSGGARNTALAAVAAGVLALTGCSADGSAEGRGAPSQETGTDQQADSGAVDDILDDPASDSGDGAATVEPEAPTASDTCDNSTTDPKQVLQCLGYEFKWAREEPTAGNCAYGPNPDQSKRFLTMMVCAQETPGAWKFDAQGHGVTWGSDFLDPEDTVDYDYLKEYHSADRSKD